MKLGVAWSAFDDFASSDLDETEEEEYARMSAREPSLRVATPSTPIAPEPRERFDSSEAFGVLVDYVSEVRIRAAARAENVSKSRRFR